MKIDRRSYWLTLDVLAVALFVGLGRDTHDEELDPGELLETAAPFLIGLVLGWLAARAWRSPLSLRTGLIVALVAVTSGMACRRLAFDEGTAPSFVAVTTIFLVSAMLGWRAVTVRTTRTDRAPTDAEVAR